MMDFVAVIMLDVWGSEGLWRKQLAVDFKSGDDISSIDYGFGDGCDSYIIGDDHIIMVIKDKWS